MLEIQDLYVGYYEDLHILRGLSLRAESGKLTAILGANGVGKSTLLKAVYGFLTPHSGQVLLNGNDVTGTATHRLIDLGISYIPQQPGVFKHMSVRENLMLGAWTFQKDKKRIESKIEDNFHRFPILREKQHDHA
ncbi:MAG: ATP-binding cassette domain-containing protein, partial [Chloroflexi bacterium]|nr:ATP-binding cassette domain-containing protein [Chloroflexota bacterium]